MLKKGMHKIFKGFYIFSKLLLSIILLVCLISVLYVFYLNYNNQEKIAKKNTINKEVINNITKNSELINKILNEIKLNEVMLEDIKKNMEFLLNQETKIDINGLDKNIDLLNENFNYLSKEIQKLKDTNVLDLKTKNKKEKDIIKGGRTDIIDIIYIKYQNNVDFSKELEYLREIISEDKTPNLEKLLILANKPYKGHDNLKEIFNDEVSIYFKNKINKNPESFFSKILLPYLEISPSSENLITDDLIKNIKDVKINIENRNIENAFKKIKNIENYQIIFAISFLEINKYIEFKNELFGLM